MMRNPVVSNWSAAPRVAITNTQSQGCW